MRPVIATLLTGALLLPFAAPAEAHIVYFKDGTSVRGAVTVKDTSITIKGSDAELSFPLESVRSVSFTDEPIAYEQRRVEESRFFNSDVLIWSAIGVNLLTIAAAIVSLSRPAAGQP